MPGQLSPQELVAFQQDTDYINAGIPVWSSRVTTWGTMIILIYHTQDIGFVVSDISDLPPSLIDQLMTQSEVHGMWYYLPQETQNVISERSEQLIAAAKIAGTGIEDITKRVAADIGNILKEILQPLAPILIFGVAVALIYLTKKG